MTLAEIIVRLVLAMLLGGVIGLERELRDRAAGFRTHILVCVGAATFTIASVYGLDPFVGDAAATNVRLDPGRIAAQVVSGIGFLGAGAIIRHGMSVRGLTTAASLWAVAAVGLATGLGLYPLAIASATLVVVSLYAFRFVEHHVIYPKMRNLVDLHIRFSERGFGPLPALVERMDEVHVVVQKMSVEKEDQDINSIRLVLELPKSLTPATLIRIISEVEGVEELSQN